MEAESQKPASASASASASPHQLSLRSCITAQENAAVISPHLVGCHIKGNVSINAHVHPPVQSHQTNLDVSSHTAPAGLLRISKSMKSKLRVKFGIIFEGIARRGNATLFREMYTELYITVGENEGVNKEHEVWNIDPAFHTSHDQDIPISCNDIFRAEPKVKREKIPAGEHGACRIRTVITKGIAGIGKTVSVQRFILDWAEEKANQDIELLLVLPFRELNCMINETFTLHELLCEFHSELRDVKDVKYYQERTTLLIFDGLDESKLDLDFGKKRISSVSKAASVDELIINVIKGNLLPSALVWITSRPAAVDRVPADLIQRVTEVRGFTAAQKEEYFRKRSGDPSVAERIISHVKDTRSLEIMCHIPVFCWIIAMVLERMLMTGNERIPSSLTEMYTRFLLMQTNEKKKKYQGMAEKDPLKLSDADVEILMKLGKLAFEKLQQSNIVFSEDDLIKYGIDVTEASVRSGVFTAIFREEDPMVLVKMYSFVHLSFQEYLAALFVLRSFTVGGINQMQSKPTTRHHVYRALNLSDEDEDGDDLADCDGLWKAPQPDLTLHALQRIAIENAMKSKSGHLDLFLRFLLGLSMESSLKLLKSIPLKVEKMQENIDQTIRYIKSMLREEDDRKAPSSERCVNLFHCLLELDDHSAAEEIRRFLTNEKATKPKLTAVQCSTLAYIILMSREILQELDLNEYNVSDEGRKRLVPAVRKCRRALMADCGLTAEDGKILASALQDPDSPLREMDLSRNFSLFLNPEILHPGVNSPYYKVQNLNISHCNLEKSGASLLRAVLTGPHPQPHTLTACACYFKDDCAEVLLSALQSSQCNLKDLDVSYNCFTSTGMNLVLQGLQSPNCSLQKLRLCGSQISGDSCTHLSSALQHSFIKELILDSCSVSDVGVKRLCSGLMSPHCQLQTLGLRECNLTWKSCVYLAVTLATYSVVKTLNLRDNDLQDSGVQFLAVGLKNPNCVLQELGLSGCFVTLKGCDSLASALSSNPSSVLRDLDLSYNHPQALGKKLLTDLLNDPGYKLQKLRLDHDGQARLANGLWKYQQELTMAYTDDLVCSHDMKGIARVPDKREYMNFDVNKRSRNKNKWVKASCRETLRDGRFYWEVQWTGLVTLVLKEDKSSYVGQSLKFLCNVHQCIAMHEDRARMKSAFIFAHPEPKPGPKTFGIYLDFPEGTLTFYHVSSRRANRLYTFHTTFNKAVIPEFHLNRLEMTDGITSVIILTQSPHSAQNTTKQLLHNMLRHKLHHDDDDDDGL